MIRVFFIPSDMSIMGKVGSHHAWKLLEAPGLLGNFNAPLEELSSRQISLLKFASVHACLSMEDPLGKKWQPIPYSCLENFMARGTWQAIGHGVAKSQTQLSMHSGTPLWENQCLLVFVSASIDCFISWWRWFSCKVMSDSCDPTTVACQAPLSMGFFVQGTQGWVHFNLFPSPCSSGGGSLLITWGQDDFLLHP